jgi:hypothetical protein
MNVHRINTRKSRRIAERFADLRDLHDVQSHAAEFAGNVRAEQLGVLPRGEGFRRKTGGAIDVIGMTGQHVFSQRVNLP